MLEVQSGRRLGGGQSGSEWVRGGDTLSFGVRWGLVLGSSAGDSYDNAQAETTNGLYKMEGFHNTDPWKTIEQVEYATKYQQINASAMLAPRSILSSLLLRLFHSRH